MVERDRSGLPDDPWEELLHQGDVSERSVTAIPLVVAALAGGTDDDADWLYLLAALCIGRPERLAERIRSAAQAGAAREELWQRADFEYVLRDNGLPESRPALQAWLVD